MQFRNYMKDLREIYSRRMSDTDLAFPDWIREVQRRAEIATGVKPELTAKALVLAIEQPLESTKAEQ